MNAFSESTVEKAALAWLESLSYAMLPRKITDRGCVQDGGNPLEYLI
ncbi:MAG: hypothetical protein GWP10_10515 [Nitrospiraceae bacterium]|nr:hypothetical protein [Nitrospiraceae bacterium]